MFGNLPPFGSACVIVEEHGRFLVIKRPERTTVFPGGFMRWQESAEETARREGKEETGLDLHIGRMIGYRSTPTINLDHMSTLTIFFQASVIGGDLQSSIEGQPCWLDEETLSKCLHDYYKPVFDDYLHHQSKISFQETNALEEK